MKMGLPNVKQDVGTSVCGPVCLLNIYSYFGIKTTLDKILSDLKTDKNQVTYTPQLAQHLLKNNFQTVIVNSNPRSTTLEWRDLPTETVIEKLKQWIENNTESEWLKLNLFLLFYLQEGGKMKTGNLSTKIIDNYLKEGYVILTAVEQSWLWGKRKLKGKVKFDDIKGVIAGHMVTIFKEERDNYILSDPYPTGLKESGVYEINKDQLLTAILTWSAQILATKKV